MDKTTDWLVCVGDGWHGLVRPLVEYANAHGIKILQVKEKFGGLRFYVSGSDSTMEDMIAQAEAESFKTCEVCGAPGQRRGGGWIRTLCDAHAPEPLKDAAD